MRRTDGRFWAKVLGASLVPLSCAALLAETSGGVVAKTQYSDTLRFVFVAGLEGAGHHAWQSLLTPCRTRMAFCFELRSFTRAYILI
jgi:hypothetical protein